MRWLVLLFLGGCACAGPVDGSSNPPELGPSETVPVIVERDAAPVETDGSRAPKETGVAIRTTLPPPDYDAATTMICKTNVGGVIDLVPCSIGFSWAPVGSSDMTACTSAQCPVGAWCETYNGVSGVCE